MRILTCALFPHLLMRLCEKGGTSMNNDWGQGLWVLKVLVLALLVLNYLASAYPAEWDKVVTVMMINRSSP